MRRTLAAVVLAAASLAAACGDGGGGGAAADETATDETATDETGAGDTGATGTEAAVTIETFIFDPDPLVVAPGTTVTFENTDGTVHTVTAGTREAPEPEAFDGELDEGATFEHRFDEPGTYPYFCAIHSGEGMTGEVRVEG